MLVTPPRQACFSIDKHAVGENLEGDRRLRRPCSRQAENLNRYSSGGRRTASQDPSAPSPSPSGKDTIRRRRCEAGAGLAAETAAGPGATSIPPLRPCIAA